MLAFGAPGLLAIRVWLGVLATGGGEKPTWLPLENYGITEYKVIDSDVSNNGLRAVDVTVSSGDATSPEEYRAISRSIEDDEEYSDRHYISILFIKRQSGASPRYVAAVALSSLGRDQVSRIQDRPAYGSKDGDGVYLYTFPKWTRVSTVRSSDRRSQEIQHGKINSAGGNWNRDR